MKKYVFVSLLAGALLCGAVALFAQESTPTKEQEAAQEAWMKAATPGIHHQHLKALAGSWEYTSKMWMDPSAPPEESKGTCVRTMILGDRYLREEFTGDFQGMPFKGIGITGYDNLAEKYKTVWIDNMGTAIMTGEGQCTDDGKTLTIEMQYIDIMTGKPSTMRAVSQLVAPDKQVAQYFGPGPDGAEFKTMEFVLTRK